MSSLAFRSFAATLRSHGLSFDDTKGDLLRVAWNGTPHSFAIFIMDLDGGEEERPFYRLGIIVTPDYSVPEARRSEVAALLNTLNADRLVGAWELDVEDGQLRYRVGFPVEGPLKPITCDYLLSLLTTELERALPVFLAVGDDGISAEDAAIFLSIPPGALN